MGGCLLSNK